jgi:hypothetical protein
MDIMAPPIYCFKFLGGKKRYLKNVAYFPEISFHA